MLPEFPEIRKLSTQLISRLLKKQATSTLGIINEIPKTCIYEGDIMEFTRADGTKTSLKMKRISSEATIKKEDFEKEGISAYIKSLEKAGEDLGGKLVKFTFERIDEELEKAGQIVKSKEGFSVKSFMEMLEKTDIEFDRLRRPKLQIVANPHVRKLISKIESSPEEQRELDALMQRKYNDFRMRKSNRRLVD